jgi:hypothetical protein
MMLTLLIQAAAGERGWLEFMQSEMSRQRVMGITPAGDSLWIHFDYPSARPTNPAPTRHAFGFLPSLFAFGVRDMDSRNEPVEMVSQSSFPSATLAIVKTKTDDKHGWLAAGLTMARIVLQAQGLGLSWAFFNQVRRREARQALRVGVGHKGFAQAILCFGPLTAVKAPLSPAPIAPSLTGPHAASLNPS